MHVLKVALQGHPSPGDKTQGVVATFSASGPGPQKMPSLLVQAHVEVQVK